jgi:hypothetical protein
VLIETVLWFQGERKNEVWLLLGWKKMGLPVEKVKRMLLVLVGRLVRWTRVTREERVVDPVSQ